METISPAAVNSVVVKQEPVDETAIQETEDANNSSCSNASHSGSTSGKSGGDTNKENTDSADLESSSSSHPLRYISRRGRPPGGGYSMKSAHSHYMSFGQSAVSLGSHDFLRQSSLSTSNGSSSQDLLKNGIDSTGLDSLDARRFSLHCFEGDKNSFRCDGCDVVFGSRDTYAMHMLLRAKNESCVALPTAAISANPENPTPREKFERELREKAMINAIRSQATLMSKAAAAVAALPRNSSVVETSIPSLSRSPNSTKDDLSHFGTSELTAGLSNLFAFDTYGLYMDQRQYRRLLSEYSLRAASSPGALSAIMEQLSCSVCGEMFTNKDALAMHMMFHTRDEETESKPVISSWKTDTSPTSVRKMLPLTVNTETPVSRSRSYSEHSKKAECGKSEGDRQITAERIAELKRMAIESSLKSFRKQSNSLERNPRPRSVSEDTVVTSSAHTRPLSADDVIKLSRSAEKGIYKPHKTIFKRFQKDTDDNGDANENNDNHCNEKTRDNSDSSKFPFRKRTLSISDAYSSRAYPFYKRQRHFYSDNDVRSFGFRYDQFKSSISDGETSNFSKVCDNHVSSASGPQDSDETSNGSSNVAMETTTTDGNRTLGKLKIGRDEASSSLDNIMSGDTILVPVENLSEEEAQGNDEGDEFPTRLLQREGVTERAAAIDFSLGKQRTRDSNEDGCSIESPSPVLSSSRLNHPRNKYIESHDMTSSQGVGGDGVTRRDSVSQHQVELVPDGSQSSDSKECDGRRSYDVSSDSSRIGEARYCPHCEILFLDVTLFHLHMGLHNVNNPWQCNICGLACAGRLEFNTHVLHY